MLLLLPDGLKTLQLGAHITPNGDTMKAIREKRRLEHLTLEDCSEILDSDLMDLLSLNKLQSLQLWRAHRFSTSGLLNFFYNSNFLHLRHLDLFDCSNLNDEVLQEISIRCSQVETLDISSCHLITDNGVASIFQFCSNLHTLKMSHLPQPSGRDYLYNLHEQLPKLIYLDAYNCCNISIDLLASLENEKLIVMYGKRISRFHL